MKEKSVNRPIKNDKKAMVKINGLQKLKDIVNAVDPIFKKKLLDLIEEKEPVLSRFLEFHSFDFSILLRLDNVNLQRFLQGISDKDWIEALVDASIEVKEYIFKQLSPRRKEDWQEQIDQVCKSQSPATYKLASIKSQNRILGKLHKSLSTGQIRLVSKPRK